MSKEKSYEIIDILLHSRRTLLNILAERGYATKPFENFGPDEIRAMIRGKENALQMVLEREQQPDSTIVNCHVHYVMPPETIKNKLANAVGKIINLEDPDLAKTTEFVILLNEPTSESFHAMAYSLYLKHKLRVSFIPYVNLIVNPRKHILVPAHERVPKEEHEELLKKLYLRSKVQLPLIRFHEDMQARLLGLIPGDIVKITRPSASSGEYVLYRVCAP